MCNGRITKDVGTVDGFRFVQCERCYLVFCPALTDAESVALYGSGYHGTEDGAPKRGWAKTQFLQPALDLFDDAQPLTILDFGAGQSLVPNRLRQRGHRVYAVDIVPPIEPHPDRLTGGILQLELPADSFDLVYSFQVFEHLPDPRPILLELLRILKPGGYLFIHTDMETPEREPDFAAWWYVTPPDHCTFYRHRTFTVFLADTPHELVACDNKYVILCKNPSTALSKDSNTNHENSGAEHFDPAPAPHQNYRPNARLHQPE
jgi:SAM-dependent methyltransferase